MRKWSLIIYCYNTEDFKNEKKRLYINLNYTANFLVVAMTMVKEET